MMQGRNPPQNCIQAFSKEGDQIFTNRSYTAEHTRAKFLSGDVEEEIRCVCICVCVCLCVSVCLCVPACPSLIFLDEAVVVRNLILQLPFVHCFNVSNYLTVHFSLRHLQRELENQRAQANSFQQQMKKLDDEVKQNEGLLRRTHIEQKTTKVPSL